MQSMHVDFCIDKVYNAGMQNGNGRVNKYLAMLRQAGVTPQELAAYMAQRGMGNAHELQQAIESGSASCCSNETRNASLKFAQDNPQLVQQMQQVLSGC